MSKMSIAPSGLFEKMNSQGINAGLRQTSFGHKAKAPICCRDCGEDKFENSSKTSENQTKQQLTLACRLLAYQQEVIVRLKEKLATK